MWLTMLWANKTLVAVGLCALLVAGLATALKIQSSRLTTAQERIGVETSRAEAAIEAHDALVDDFTRQGQVLAEMAALRAKREEDNAKLQARLRRALADQARAWGDAALPDSIVSELPPLQTVPTAATARPVSRPDTPPGAGE